MNPEYTITQDYYDCHDEQHDAKLEAKDKQGNVVGTLWFSVYHDEPAVKYIDVGPSYRRQGIGSALIKELQKLFPDQTINIGGTTNLGTKLIDSLQFQTTRNPEYDELAKRQAEVTRELAIIKDFFDKLYSGNKTIKPSKEIEEKSEAWNRLSDEAYRIELQLIHMKKEKRVIANWYQKSLRFSSKGILTSETRKNSQNLRNNYGTNSR